MPDEEELRRAKEEARRRAVEETKREFEDDAPRGPSLRIVPMPRPEPWAAPTWLPTGEAVMLEVKRKHGEDFYFVPFEALTFHWSGIIWELDEVEQATRLAAQMCREIGVAKSKKSIRSKIEAASFVHGVARRFREEVSGPLERFDATELICTPEKK